MEEIKAGYENVRLQDGDGNKITSTGGALSVSATIAEEALAADGGALPAKVKVIGGFDGTDVQAIQTDSAGGIEVGGNTLSAISYNNTVIANIDTNLTAVALGQQNGAQKTQLVDAAGEVADVKQLSVNLVAGDKGLVTNTIIHGETTGGGGGYVDVKVTPSGALTTDSTLAGLDASVLGQDTMANSLPVTIASNQTAIPITDNSGSITVDGSVSVSSSALPTGAATETTLQSIDTHLFELDAAIVLDKAIYTIGGGRVVVGGYVFDDVADAPALSENSAAAARININRSQVGVIEDASTRGRYATVTASNALKVDGSAVTQPVSVASMPLPTGAATESTLQGVATESTLQAVATESTLQSVDGQLLGIGVNVGLINTEVSSIEAKTPALGQAPMANSTPVVIASNQSNIPVVQAGKTAVNLARIDYSSTNVTTAAYTQLLASTSAVVSEVEIFDSSGQTLFFSTGSAGSESDKIYIIPGGNGRIPLSIAAGTRVAIKAVSATANAGEISVNFYS
jgi:hypothetical protein